MALGGSYTVNERAWADERIRWYQAAVAAHPRSISAHHGLGFALSDKGNFDGAIAEYRAAIQLDPSNASASYNKCLTWLTASGKGACSATLGLFGACEPFDARQERLSYNFARRIESLEEDRGNFAVLKAKAAHDARPVRGSVFRPSRTTT